MRRPLGCIGTLFSYCLNDRIPDETTILAFRDPLGKHDLGEQNFETVKAHLKANSMAIKHDHRRHFDHLTKLYQEQEGRERFPNAPDQEGQTVVLRDESPHRCGRGQRPDPLDRNDLCQRA